MALCFLLDKSRRLFLLPMRAGYIMTQPSVKHVEPLPYDRVEPRWLELEPQSGCVLIYNANRADLYSTSDDSLTLKADLTSLLAVKYKPRQVKFCGPSGCQLLVTGGDRKCHLVDTATGQSLASTLGEHDFFAVEQRDRFAYLVDYQQEILVRYNWPTLRNACALSLIRKTNSALSTVLDSLHPWDVALAGDYLLVTKAYGNASFPESCAAVCLNARQKTWTGALDKPDRPARQKKKSRQFKMKGSTATTAGSTSGVSSANSSSSTFSRCYGNYWLPGDRYLAWNGRSRVLYLASPGEGAIYAYALDDAARDSPSSSSDSSCHQEPIFCHQGVLYLPDAVPEAGQQQASADSSWTLRSQLLQPGCLAVDPDRGLLRVLVGDCHAGGAVSCLVTCDIPQS